MAADRPANPASVASTGAVYPRLVPGRSVQVVEGHRGAGIPDRAWWYKKDALQAPWQPVDMVQQRDGGGREQIVL